MNCFHFRQGPQLSLLKPSVAMNFPSNSPNTPAPASQSPLMQIWRTRILAQVLVHLWLSVEDESKANFSPAYNRSAYIEAASLVSITPTYRRDQGKINQLP